MAAVANGFADKDAGTQKERYRRALLQRQSQLQADLKRAAASAREQLEPGALDPADESVLSHRKETLFAQVDRDTQLLNEVQHALRRLQEGTYGICEQDGEPIDPIRLEAVPWARYCVKHQAERDATAESERHTTL
ncbi:MAG: TraR/DksA C4-type zinc finger protein [Acidobacteria bacterium]|nr:TraR/DksA C4-type zinc finger protein [Acidobacteriota bacterium]